MGRITLEDPAPAEAQERKVGKRSIRWTMTTHQRTGNVWVKVWWGNAKRPTDYYSFKTMEQAQQFVDRRVASFVQSEEYKAERRKADRERAAQMREQVQPGTIFVNSWGYEQTNVDAYQVVEVKGKATVLLRRIATERVAGERGWAEQVRPVADAFVDGEAPITKRLNGWGVSFDHGSARIHEDGKTYYASYYA